MTFRTNFKSDMPSRVEDRLERDAQTASNERRWDKEIDHRDHRQCRACGKRTNPDEIGLLRGHRAHIVYASACGSWEPSNRVTLCPRCHQDEHKDRLRFTREGGPYVGIDANEPMSFWRPDDQREWYLDRREVFVGVVEQD